MHPLSLLHGHHYIQDRLTTVRGDVSGPGISSRKRLNQVCLHNAFGARYKESPRSVQFIESREDRVGFVNDIKRAGLDVALLAEQVEYFDVAYINETWNGALQIYQRIKLDYRFGRQKRSPNTNLLPSNRVRTP